MLIEKWKVWEVDVKFCTSVILIVVKVCNFHCTIAPSCAAAWMMLLSRAAENVAPRSLGKCGKGAGSERRNSTVSKQFRSDSKAIPRYLQFSHSSVVQFQEAYTFWVIVPAENPPFNSKAEEETWTREGWELLFCMGDKWRRIMFFRCCMQNALQIAVSYPFVRCHESLVVKKNVVSKWRRGEWKRKEKTLFQNVLAIRNAFPLSPSCPSWARCLCEQFWLPTWQETAGFWTTQQMLFSADSSAAAAAVPLQIWAFFAVDRHWQRQVPNAYRPISLVWFVSMLGLPINPLKARVTVEVVHVYLDQTGSPTAANEWYKLQAIISQIWYTRARRTASAISILHTSHCTGDYTDWI